MVIPEGVVRTKLDIYQMVDTSAGGVLVIKGITRPVVSTLVIEGVLTTGRVIPSMTKVLTTGRV
jgi:hypothetical protein